MKFFNKVTELSCICIERREIIDLYFIKLELERSIDKETGKVIAWGCNKWIRQKDGGYVNYISGIHMLIFCFRNFHRNLKQLKNQPSKWVINELRKYFKGKSWDKRWWYKLTHWYFNKRYAKVRDSLPDILKKVEG